MEMTAAHSSLHYYHIRVIIALSFRICIVDNQAETKQNKIKSKTNENQELSELDIFMAGRPLLSIRQILSSWKWTISQPNLVILTPGSLDSNCLNWQISLKLKLTNFDQIGEKIGHFDT